MTGVGFELYLITDRRLTRGRTLTEVVEEVLKAGVKAVQLREKDLQGGELLRMAKELRRVTRNHGAKLLINDRLDVALAVGADGVHLGQGSFPPRNVRSYLGEGKLIGVSTHGVEEAIRAEEEGADFITLGPVYRTPSKERYGPPVGLNTLKETAGKVKIPVFAIGGVKKDRIEEVISSGASGAALISAVIGAEDAGKTAGEILVELKRSKGVDHDKA
ncbi:MAG: thiamine phosphate synthase [Thermodesulfobacteriota bacterium]